MHCTRVRAPLTWISLGLLVRWLPSLWVPFFSKDEGFWWALGAALDRGGLLYQAGVDHKPPLFLGSYGLAVSLAGTHAMALLHGVVLCCHVAVAISIHWLTRRGGNALAARYATGTYLLLIIAFITQEVWAANSEVFMLPWMMGAVMAYQRLTESAQWRWTIIIGLLIGIAAHFRQTALFLLPALLLHRWLTADRKGRILAEALLVAGSALFIFGLHALYFWQRGTFPEFWFWNITMSHAYIGEPITLATATWEFTWHTSVILLAALPVWWLVAEAVWQSLANRWSKNAVPVLLGDDAPPLGGGLAEPAATMPLNLQRTSMSAAAARKPQTTRTPSEGRGIAAPATLEVCCLAAMSLAVCIGWRFSHHYYLHLFPFAALLCGVAVATRSAAGKTIAPFRPALAALLLLLPALGFTAEGYYRWYQQTQGGPRPGLRTVAHWLQAHAAPGDSLFIWGYYPDIYADSGLPNASRYVETHFLTGQLREATAPKINQTNIQLWRWLLDDFVTHPPTWFIDTTMHKVSGRYMHPLTLYPELADYVRTHYELVDTIEQVPIYRRHD